MPVLSIIACEMLEDELVYVLSKDTEIKHLFVVANRNSFRFVQKLKRIWINSAILALHPTKI